MKRSVDHEAYDGVLCKIFDAIEVEHARINLEASRAFATLREHLNRSFGQVRRFAVARIRAHQVAQ